MKRFLVLILALLLLAIPVSAVGNLIQDDSGLLTDTDIERLEELYAGYAESHGFTPALVTTDSFGGISAEDFAGQYYDIMAYPEDGILLLVSLEEGQWYILTNGECHARISDWDAEAIGEELVPMLRDGTYYAAFLKFPELAAEVFEANAPVWEEDADVQVAPAVPKKNYGKTIFICMAVGMLIGLIVVGIMAARMKTVRMQSGASDYIRSGSMTLTQRQDIFLYSHVSRTPRPKSNSSGGGHRSGGSRGGAGGRL